MDESINQKLKNAEELTKHGLSHCNLASEKKVWLYTFANPFTTAKKASYELKLSPNTTRNALNSLVSKSLLRSEEHTSELQSRGHLVCRLLLEKKNKRQKNKE